jgi:hypothetical protein
VRLSLPSRSILVRAANFGKASRRITLNSILTLLRDSSWGFAGALISLVAAVVAVWTVLRETKSLEVSIDEHQLVGIKDDLGGKLQLLFEGVQKSEIWLVTVSFLKRGSNPVLPTDFDRPLTITLTNTKSEVLKCAIRDVRPEQLIVECAKTSPNAVTISPLVLNSGDRFRVELLVSDYAQSGVRLDYRIAGVPEIVRVNDFERKKFAPNWIFNLISMAISLWVITMLDPSFASGSFRALAAVALVFATAMTVAEVYLVRPFFRRWGHKLRRP